MGTAEFEDRVAAVRRFNRFYTQKIGVLQEGLLDSPFSLTQARVLYEMAYRERPIARELERELGLDPGYLSRILRGFQRQGLIERSAITTDRRQRPLSLTAAGRAAFAPLDDRSRSDIGAMIGELPEPAQQRLVAAMSTVEKLLDASAPGAASYSLRPHRPGDMGWVTSRHGALYAEEYGWDISFEALVAEITAAFVNNFDAGRERCWIAEIGGEPVGSIFAVADTAEAAKLRLLLVEPSARGLGIGRRLVGECIAFARQTGYHKITLWTQSILVAARNIYRDSGFRLVREEPHHSFGHDLVGEYWELQL
jgi:DNA-binding MarR family transcriptional regulator/GNAT superfamily N-acetyltransferase